MASAMAAVVPPFSGGKVYATKNGKFTFVNVLFDIDGTLLCTLDGDALTALPHAGGVRARDPRPGAPMARSPRPRSSAPAGRAGTTCEMLAAELPGLTDVRIADLDPEAVAAMVARARRGRHPGPVAAIDAVTAVDGADVIVTVTQST